jgi:hypothetical protein
LPGKGIFRGRDDLVAICRSVPYRWSDELGAGTPRTKLTRLGSYG